MMNSMKRLQKPGRTVLPVLLFLSQGAAYAQMISSDSFLSSVESTLKSSSNSIANIVSIIIGLVGIVMLAWQWFRYNKGEQQTNDSLVKIGGGLVIVVILFQIIKAALLI